MSHNHGSMAGTDSGDDTSSSSSSTSDDVMPMVFQWAVQTPIYSYAFTPKSTPQYVGALIFLIVLSIIYRALVAYKSHKESTWREEEKARKVIIAGQFHDDKASADVSTREVRGAAPWRWRVDLPRSLLSTVNIGLHYLLMFAVMTLNVGYFFAVLLGVFIGDLIFARYGH
ncbi:hypothetical protein TWF481_008609 [Arthrobotrys musiformis]|uniref:Copper transport protein n=1 Tax=Arthrobotrys musiformis TaxID=47236 RepID=A0AAV9W8K7_9PEZI